MISAKTTSRAILVPALILFAACAKNPHAGDPNSKTTDSEGSTTVTSGGTAATSSTTTATQRRPSVESPAPTVNPAGNQPVSQDPSAAQPAPPATMSSMSMASGSVMISQDPALVKKGEGVFKSKACTTCHTVGKGRLAGPDLAGVTTRRDAAWLTTWLHDPPAVVASGDATATALVAEYKGVKMPNMRLTDADIEALLAYLGAHSGK